MRGPSHLLTQTSVEEKISRGETNVSKLAAEKTTMKQADITSYLIGEEKKSINNKTKNKNINKTKNNSKRNNSKTTPTVSEKELLKRKGYWVEMTRKSKEKETQKLMPKQEI